MEISILNGVIFISPVILYLLVLLWLSRGLRLQTGHGIRDEHPLVTIVISLHNEAKNIARLIDCLMKLDYPAARREIILVNDRSTDQTGELLKEAAGKIDNCRILTVSRVDEDFAPKKFALDLAIRQAKGEIILLTDADGRPGSKWVQQMVAQFFENVGMVLGHAPYDQAGDKHTIAFQLLRIEYFSHAAIAAATTGLGFPLTCVGTNLAYRRSVYLDIGGFGDMRHIHTGDDDLFLQRVRDKTDWKISYAFDPQTFVPNAAPDNWSIFHNQRLRYASKGFIYPKWFTITLLLFYLFNLFLLLITIAALTGNLAALPVMAILVIKMISDFIFLKIAGHAFRFKLPRVLIPLASLLHIPYVLYFGLMANFRRFEWGGLSHRTGG